MVLLLLHLDTIPSALWDDRITKCERLTFKLKPNPRYKSSIKTGDKTEKAVDLVDLSLIRDESLSYARRGAHSTIYSTIVA